MSRMQFPVRHVPRWIIFLIDTTLVMLALFVAYMLRFEFTIPPVEVGPLIFAFPIYMIIRITSFMITGIYNGIIRYSSTEDSLRVLSTVIGGSLIMAIFNPLKYYYWDQAYFLPYTIIILDAVLASIFLIVFRLSAKIVYREMRNPRSGRALVIIYGAGESGVIAKRTIDQDAASHYQVFAFIDDDKLKVGKRLEGAGIFHTSDLNGLLKSNKIAQVIISIQKPDETKRRNVIEMAVAHQVNVLHVPPVNSWIDQRLEIQPQLE